MQVLDLMTDQVHTVRTDTSLKAAARLMVEAGVSGLPVVDGEGLLVGVISEADFLEQERHRGWPSKRLDEVLAEGLPRGVHTVGELMSRPVASIRADAPLAKAARLMEDRRVKRLPVVDGGGRVVGIISRADVVRAFTRPDELIEDEIREDVVRRVLHLDPNHLEVEVSEGRVVLGGRVTGAADARLLEQLVERLEGVVEVESRLVWAD